MLLNHACEATLSGVAVHHVKILEYRTETDRLLVRASRGWRDGVVGKAALSATLDSPPGRAYQTGRSVQIADMRRDASIRYSELLRSHGIVSLLNVPVRSEGFSYGVLEVDGTSPQEWTQEDVFFLEGVAHLIVAALQRSTAEQKQETLYRELQHRLKNNSAMIVAMIEGQRRMATGDEARSMLTQLSRRVHTISKAHSLVRPQDGASTLNVGLYVVDLCENLQAAAPIDRIISLRCAADERLVNVDEAVSLGLIVTELVLNGFEHAFPDMGGRIDVRVKFDGVHGELSVTDNGKGIIEEREGSRRLQLVSMLAEQLNGSFEIRPNSAGIVALVRFMSPHRAPDNVGGCLTPAGSAPPLP